MSKFKVLVVPASMFLLLTFSLTAAPSAASRQQDDLVGTEFFFETDTSFDPDYPGGQPPTIIFLGQTEPSGLICGDFPISFLSKTVIAPGHVPALQGNRARFVYILHEQFYPAGTEATFLGWVDSCGALNIYKAVITNVPKNSPTD
jgi:hypothetical protein